MVCFVHARWEPPLQLTTNPQVNNLQTDKEKLESYTKKTLHKFQDKYMVAISHCKAQIAEKNEKIDYLEVPLPSVRFGGHVIEGHSYPARINEKGA